MWQVDNRGNRLIVTDDSDINTPAVAAAYAIKRYSKQAQDEISFEVGVKSGQKASAKMSKTLLWQCTYIYEKVFKKFWCSKKDSLYLEIIWQLWKVGTSFDHETSFKVLVLGTFLCFAFYVDVLRKYRFMISSVINVSEEICSPD